MSECLKKFQKFPIFCIVILTKTPQWSEHAFTMSNKHAGMTLGEIAASSGDIERV